MIINGENLILGRLATIAAKKALLGEKIDVINCEKVVISGKRKEILSRYKEKAQIKGELKGPYLSKTPDRFVRRSIRGMLPYKQYRGEKAFKKIMCHIGTPDKLKDQKQETLKEARMGNLRITNTITVKEVCQQLKK
tara:strand:+ start:4487 stop:4897 length:411 start_codon:yes stop_codon:yes gene_type:complete